MKRTGRTLPVESTVVVPKNSSSRKMPSEWCLRARCRKSAMWLFEESRNSWNLRYSSGMPPNFLADETAWW